MSDTQNQAPGGDAKAYVTAAEHAGIEPAPPPTQGDARNGLTKVFGLQELKDSTVPSGPGQVVHVFGPGQNAVDPVAAGLDTRLIGVAAPAARVMTQTGEVGSGQRPFTYVEHTGPEMVKQSAPADGQHVPEASLPTPAPPDALKPVPPAKSKVSDQPLPSGASGQAPAPAPQSAPSAAPAAKPPS